MELSLTNFSLAIKIAAAPIDIGLDVAAVTVPFSKNAGAKLQVGGLYHLVSNATDEVDVLRQKSWSVKKIFSGFGVKPQSRKNLQ